MKKYTPYLILLLCLGASVSFAASAADGLLSGMHGKWRVDEQNPAEPLFMTIDVNSKTVTVSNANTSKSDKFTVGFEDGNSIVLIARDHREAMYFEITDDNTMISKTDANTVSRVLKRVDDHSFASPESVVQKRKLAKNRP
jgi:Cu/Ag efflux protein CusF